MDDNDLLDITVNAQGRIAVIRHDQEEERSEPLPCSCRNQHQNLDGFIYTDPGCKIHGRTIYHPNPNALEEEKAAEERAKRASVKKRTGIAQRKRVDAQTPVYDIDKYLNRFIGTGEPVH